MLLPKQLLHIPLWLLLLGALLLGLGLTARGYGQTVQQAGVVVVSGDGTVTTRCVSFTTETIRAIDLLRQSELALETQNDPGLGEFVCKIGQEGCPADNCACAYPPTYWRYWLKNADAQQWQFSGLGASSRTLRAGDVDGWVWSDTNVAPPVIAFADICPNAELPTATVAPAATPIGTPTATPTVAPAPRMDRAYLPLVVR
ncbi:MAG: hypothetical protein HC911_02080 [Chloroflexaceae bacterium]|nr:hypothetical protein [Chloroflexaceae bacterium]